MAKITRGLLIFLLMIEGLAAVWPLSEAVMTKNRLAAWPHSITARQAAEELANRPRQIKLEIEAWEKTMGETTETRNGLLRLAYLSWQIYKDDQARLFWERAFYLDPELVASLPRLPEL